jgi:hypothetical protein
MGRGRQSFRRSIFTALFFLFLQNLNAQINSPELSLRCDTLVYASVSNSVKFNGRNTLWFRTNDPREICELTFRVAPESGISKLKLKTSPRFRIIDSLTSAGPNAFRGKIRFNDLMASGTELIAVKAFHSSGATDEFEYPLLPVMEPYITVPPANIELMQDEEKTIEIPVRNAFNIKADNAWLSGKTMDYKISASLNSLLLTVRTHNTGSQVLALNLHTRKPILNEQLIPADELLPLSIGFYVKPFRLNYINTDKNLIYLDPGYSHTEQILVDYNHAFEMNKSYRVEDRKENGALLVAELYTQSQVENNSKIICRLRTYARHRTEEGYLFIKDEGKALFMTNLNILEKPEISSLSIRHEGGEWETRSPVYPGETIEVRAEGKGLLQAKLEFESCPPLQADSSRSSDEALFFTLHIPATIQARKALLFMNKKASTFELDVNEYQRPHPLDFISVNLNGTLHPLNDPDMDHPLFVETAISDVVLQFNADKIDLPGDLYGKQYLHIKTELLGNDDNLLEQEDFNVCICPSSQGPRGLFYDRKGCTENTVSINEKLRHKTYSLDPFTQIIITIRHDDAKYKDSEGFEKKIRIFVKRKYHVDLQISFPTGLLYKTVGETGIGNLSGLGICALAQVNFYDENRPGKYKPYSFGAGFISLNTFNFNEGPTDRRDVGLIIAATVTPYKNKSKFSFPIYAGMGYLLKAEKGFIMMGPGVQVDF